MRGSFFLNFILLLFPVAVAGLTITAGPVFALAYVLFIYWVLGTEQIEGTFKDHYADFPISNGE